MNYLMLVCAVDGPRPADADREADGEVHLSIDAWIEMCGERRIWGDALESPASARTVRVRDGETVLTDGPFIEAKEFIAGFDLLECEDLDEAIALAAAHPVAGSGMIELRPFVDGASFDGVGAKLNAALERPGPLFMLMVSVNGIPESDEVEAQLGADMEAFGAELEAAGTMPFGYGLQGVETATTVRRRSGGVTLTDGPFVEAKEFLAGFCVLECADLAAAEAIAARMPLAAFHPVEVRQFMVWED